MVTNSEDGNKKDSSLENYTADVLGNEITVQLLSDALISFLSGCGIGKLLLTWTSEIIVERQKIYKAISLSCTPQRHPHTTPARTLLPAPFLLVC